MLFCYSTNYIIAQPQAQNDYQPLSVQQNDYHIDTSGIFDRRLSSNDTNNIHNHNRNPSTATDPQTPETPLVALNDRPYPLRTNTSFSHELPTEYHDNNAYQGSDAKFFDPNGDPERPYGDYTPVGSAEDLHAPEGNGRPRLSLANPDDYGDDEDEDYDDQNSNTPTIHGMAGESSYNDRANPFVEHIPPGAGLPAFEISGQGQGQRRQSYAPAAQIWNEQARTQSPATRTRALLPSQMRGPTGRSGSPAPLTPAYATATSISNVGGGYDPTARHQIKRKPSPNPEIQQSGGLEPGNGRDVDVQSAFGSVRRRYDGSGYGDWED